MGLCKCPRKVVTALFCYVHRVNVCQACLVLWHPCCVVQTYLEWLQDAHYDPTCGFCSEPLRGTDCCRLDCLHVFHWECLERQCRSLPPTTAPPGYVCPTCGHGIFPRKSSSTQVADELRRKLASVAWGQKGLDEVNLLPDDDLAVAGPSGLNSSPTMSLDISDTSLSGASTISAEDSSASIPLRRVAPIFFHSPGGDADDDKYSRLPEILQPHGRNIINRNTFTLRNVLGWVLCICLVTLVLSWLQPHSST